LPVVNRKSKIHQGDFMREEVFTDKGAKPVGIYSQGIVASGKTVYISGQGPIDPATGQLVKGSFREEAERVFQNLAILLEAAGTSWANVTKVGVAVGAANFSAHHAVSCIGMGADSSRAHPIPEAGPAGTGIKLGSAAVELSVTADAVVAPVALLIPVGASEWPLGAALAGNTKLLGCQLLAPLLLAGTSGQATVEAAG
jgi:enamine deaminase RidA (YjgF/YER057c/UK114 family)